MSLNKMQLFTEERQHLNHPIPHSMIIQPIGRTLTQHEWQKFCKRYLSPKLAHDCHRQIDGHIRFIGEGGMEAAELFQHKFNSRFRLRLICKSEETAKEALQLANEIGINIQEVYYEGNLGEKVKLNDKSIIDERLMMH